MSRGFGNLQRQAFAWLDQQGTEPIRSRLSGARTVAPAWYPLGVARAIFGTDEPTEAQLASTRRALRGLHRAGIIYREPTTDGRAAYAVPDPRYLGLVVRDQVADAERVRAMWGGGDDYSARVRERQDRLIAAWHAERENYRRGRRARQRLRAQVQQVGSE